MRSPIQKRIASANWRIILAGVIASTAFLPVLTAYAAQLAPTVTTVSATEITLKQASLNATVNANEEQSVAWFEYGPSTSFGIGTEVQFAGSQSSIQSMRVRLTTLEPGTTYYFRIVAQNKYGTSYGNTMSFATGGGQPTTSAPSGNASPVYYPSSYNPSYSYNPPSSYYGAPTVTTLSTSNVYQTSATFNGTVFPNGYATNVWFEWGASATLGNQTPAQSISNVATQSSFVYVMPALSPNTTYYYRAVAQNAYGAVQGQVISFSTHTDGTSSASASTGTSGDSVSSGSSSGIFGSIFGSPKTSKPADPGALNLSSALSRTQPWPGSKIEYAINYSNTGAGALTAMTATIELPFEMQYSSSDIALREQNGNVLTFDLPLLKGYKNESFVVSGIIKESAEIGAQLTFKSSIAYTDAAKKNHSKETSVTAVVAPANKAPSLLALVFGGASGTVGQWLMLVSAFLVATIVYNGARKAIAGFETKI